MTKEQALEILKLLSALESWSVAHGHPPPEYIRVVLIDCVEALEQEILK